MSGGNSAAIITISILAMLISLAVFRINRKPRNHALSDRSYGLDLTPADIKRLHASTSTPGGQHDHA